MIALLSILFWRNHSYKKELRSSYLKRLVVSDFLQIRKSELLAFALKIQGMYGCGFSPPATGKLTCWKKLITSWNFTRKQRLGINIHRPENATRFSILFFCFVATFQLKGSRCLGCRSVVRDLRLPMFKKKSMIDLYIVGAVLSDLSLCNIWHKQKNTTVCLFISGSGRRIQPYCDSS